MNRKKKTEIGSCGCEISAAKSKLGKSVFICANCKGKCCSRHYYFSVDGNNRAITKTLSRMGTCSKCLGREI